MPRRPIHQIITIFMRLSLIQAYKVLHSFTAYAFMRGVLNGRMFYVHRAQSSIYGVYMNFGGIMRSMNAFAYQSKVCGNDDQFAELKNFIFVWVLL